MHNNKTLALSLLTTLLVITGCTQTQTVSNTNDSTTTNSPVNENSNTPVTNTIESDVNTSDWLTYTNEDYGFSFRYPREWHVSDKTSIQIPGQYRLVLSVGKSYDPNDYEFGLYVERLNLTDKYEQIKTSINNESNKVILSETSDSSISKTIKVKNISNNKVMTETVVELENDVVSYVCTEWSDEQLCIQIMDTVDIL